MLSTLQYASPDCILNLQSVKGTDRVELTSIDAVNEMKWRSPAINVHECLGG